MAYNGIKVIGKPKIFGIGMNKTGTSSLNVAMKELGFVVGYQQIFNKRSIDWAKRDFTNIVRYCRTAQFFQDIPFSLFYTFVVLDHEFPGSKFILTVRDSPEQWYRSLTNFHAKLYGKDGRIPTNEDLQNAHSNYTVGLLEAQRLFHPIPEDDPYHKEKLIEQYKDHNRSVLEYFRHRPDDLLVLNVAEKNAYKKLCNFLNIKEKREKFPWENKTDDIVVS